MATSFAFVFKVSALLPLLCAAVKVQFAWHRDILSSFQGTAVVPVPNVFKACRRVQCDYYYIIINSVLVRAQNQVGIWANGKAHYCCVLVSLDGSGFVVRGCRHVATTHSPAVPYPSPMINVVL